MLSGIDSKAGVLAEALPWIRAHRGATVVVKVGGEALENPELARSVAGDLALMRLVGIRLVVVHGGGPQVTRAMDEAGIEAVFKHGLRVTDDRSIEIVRRVLVGSINVDLVAAIVAAGASAVGLSGVDGGLVTAAKEKGPDGEDIGHVGRVVSVDPGLLITLADEGYIPVVASVSPGEDSILNVNADVAAGAIAAALGAEKLVYLTNVEGLYRDLGDETSLISGISAGALGEMLPDLSAGMRPKVASMLEALSAGVGKAHILDGRVEHALLLEVFTDEGVGTQVTPEGAG